VVSDLEQPEQQEKKRGEKALNQVLYLQDDQLAVMYNNIGDFHTTNDMKQYRIT
jgi:hypothetical protein